jgi:hypothetical protein
MAKLTHHTSTLMQQNFNYLPRRKRIRKRRRIMKKTIIKRKTRLPDGLDLKR